MAVQPSKVGSKQRGIFEHDFESDFEGAVKQNFECAVKQSGLLSRKVRLAH